MEIYKEKASPPEEEEEEEEEEETFVPYGCGTGSDGFILHLRKRPPLMSVRLAVPPPMPRSPSP